MTASSTLGVIPARMQSTRLPGKMLLRDTGKSLLQHTWEAARQATRLDDLLIATDDERIARAVEEFGGKAVMTGEHRSGTDRIAEVVASLSPEVKLIVNIQGDEPELDPAAIDTLVDSMQARPDVEMGTLATSIRSVATLEDRGCVKVVCAADGRALYFSRLPIPYYRQGDPQELLADVLESGAVVQSPWLLHLGIYAYRREFLLAFSQWPPSRLEQLESLEQLRALEAGASILVKTVSHHSVGIDTAADYAAFVERVRLGVQSNS